MGFYEICVDAAPESFEWGHDVMLCRSKGSQLPSISSAATTLCFARAAARSFDDAAP